MDETNQTQTSSSSNKNTVLIVVGVVVVLAIVGSFMGFFGRGPVSTAPSYFTPGVNTDQNMDGSTTFTTDEGSVTVGGTSMPSNWPSDVPTAYSGATILYSGDSNPTTGKSGSSVVYSTKASLQSVVEYYSSKLKSEGWTIEGTANSAGMTVLSAKKGERTFGAYVAEADGVTQVTVGVEGSD
jgi:hypothetical protein